MDTEKQLFNSQIYTVIREQLVELLRGGFAPNVILLREFYYNKAGIVLDSLHFSAWILLGHMQAWQTTLLNFMQDPTSNHEVWKDDYWPENRAPESEQVWQEVINHFEKGLEEMIQIIKNPDNRLFDVQPNGKTLSWAAMTTLHYNENNIGQLKTIGRQLGVW